MSSPKISTTLFLSQIVPQCIQSSQTRFQLMSSGLGINEPLSGPTKPHWCFLILIVLSSPTCHPKPLFKALAAALRLVQANEGLSTFFGLKGSPSGKYLAERTAKHKVSLWLISLQMCLSRRDKLNSFKSLNPIPPSP